MSAAAAKDPSDLLARLAAGALTPDDEAAVNGIIDRLIAGRLRPQDTLFAARLLAAYHRRSKVLAADWDPYKEWLTRDQAAVALKRSVRTLCDWARLGRGPKYQTRGGRVLYRRADIEAWVRGEEPEHGGRGGRRSRRAAA